MTGEVVNLRQARKAKARTDRADKAAENRARFGRTLSDRQTQADASARAARQLDGHRIASPAQGDEN